MGDDDGDICYVVFVFWVVDEWFVLLIGVLCEIVGMCLIYFLLYCCNLVVCGVVNICGMLCIVILIGVLFGFDVGKVGSGSDDGWFMWLLVVVY